MSGADPAGSAAFPDVKSGLPTVAARAVEPQSVGKPFELRGGSLLSRHDRFLRGSNRFRQAPRNRL
jgi:hypothetical protein